MMKSRASTRPSCVRPSSFSSRPPHRGTRSSRSRRTNCCWPPASRTRFGAYTQNGVFKRLKRAKPDESWSVPVTGEGDDPDGDGGEREAFKGEEGAAVQSQPGGGNGQPRHEDRLQLTAQVLVFGEELVSSNGIKALLLKVGSGFFLYIYIYNF